jgi:assimilatory nitrate reductase catalytic subunit
MATTHTACPYCGVGCGVLATATSSGTVLIAGDTDHPANFGRLCSKGAALAETLDLDGRLLQPQIGDQRVSWDVALDRVAGEFAAAIAEHGPDSVAMYVSGQLLTEDYYVANKLMKGFVGSANIDTNSRLCMASSVAGHRRAFGSDTVPGVYADLEQADLIVLVGSNLAWCHPVLYQRIAAAKQARPNMRIVLVDPRRTATADIADLHLPIRPDGDVALFSGLLLHLAEHGTIDRAYVETHTTGFAAALDAAIDLAAVSGLTGIETALLREFYALFARTEKVVTVYSQGVNQSAQGTEKVNAIINCHLATGRIGRPGMGPFSATGQPNAMGGREVGGLANMLAAHMEIENPVQRDIVRRFWQAPTMAEKPGLKAVDMFEAVRDGRIKALWIMATNPVDSLPDADQVAAALDACPFVVVSDVLAETDTTRHAHVKLPALAWGEKDGTVTNSERRISRQRAFLPPPGEARADWWAICEVAKRLGHGPAFDYRHVGEIFAEHAALSGFENGGTRDFDIGAWAVHDGPAYEAMTPFQWPQAAGEGPTERRFFAQGNFFTADKRARFIAVRAVSRNVAADDEMVLNTGRVRDHWHTMTRTGKSARLSMHLAEPFAELHPADAARLNIADADIVRLHSAQGEVLLRALVASRQLQGSIFAPMHWNDQFASRARIDVLVPAVTDPISGQPASKNVAVRVEKFPAAFFGFAVMRQRPARVEAEYWALARCAEGWRLELALAQEVGDWSDYARKLFAVGQDAAIVAYRDSATDQHRIVVFDGERLLGALFVARQPVAVSRQWAVQQLAQDHGRTRFAVAAGRAGGARADAGAIVCSCFGVGANDIAAAAARGASIIDIGRHLKAGTNCGSCRAEIGAIIDANRRQAAE